MRRLSAKVGVLTGGLALLLFSSTAFAGTVASNLFLDGTSINNFHDQSIEYLAYDSGSDGVLQKGDILRGAFNIGKVNSLSFGDQLTGVFSIKIGDITDLGGGAFDIEFVADDTTDGQSGLPSGWLSFNSWISSLASSPDGPATMDSGTMIRMWESSSDTWDPLDIGGNLPNNASADDIIAQAVAGTWYWDLGLKSGLASGEENRWTATGPTTLPTANSTTSDLATSLFAMSLMQNGTGPIVVKHELPDAQKGKWSLTGSWVADFDGSVSVGGAGVFNSHYPDSTPLDLTDSADLNFAAVPLPTALWPGLAMLFGLGFVRLRRKNGLA